MPGTGATLEKMAELPTADTYARAVRVARLIQHLRLRKNLSKRQLALRAQLGPTTVNQIERVLEGGPLVGLPQPDTLRQIARGLATDGHGHVDQTEAQRVHLELMTEVGYLDSPEPSVVTIPRLVLEKLVELGDADIQIGLTGRPWTDEDTENILRTIEQKLRLKHESRGTA